MLGGHAFSFDSKPENIKIIIKTFQASKHFKLSDAYEMHSPVAILIDNFKFPEFDRKGRLFFASCHAYSKRKGKPSRGSLGLRATDYAPIISDILDFVLRTQAMCLSP